LLGWIIKIFISSNLQRRPSIFKKFFMLGRIIKIFISSILKRRPSISKEFFCLVEWKKNIFLQIVSKINQGSCLGCLGGDDAPATINRIFLLKRPDYNQGLSYLALVSGVPGTHRFWQFYYIRLCFTLEFWGFTSDWYPLFKISNSSPDNWNCIGIYELLCNTYLPTSRWVLRKKE
jgi:hypothetical protein